MPPWLNNLLQPGLLVPALLLFFSIVGTVAKKMQEQKTLREIQRRRQQAELEALRTGRADASSAPPTLAATQAPISTPKAQQQRRLEEIAARRKALLEEVRRRQQVRATAAPSSAPTQSPQPAPAQSQPTQPQPARATPRPTGAPARRPAPRPAAPARQGDQRRPAASQPRPTARRPASVSPPIASRPSAPKGIPELEPEVPHLTAAQRAVGAPKAKGGVNEPIGSLRGLTRVEIRRAIVLGEVLGPPVSQRNSTF